MEIQADLVAPCSAGELFSWVDDLERYPRWLEIVPSVAVLDDGASDALYVLMPMRV